MFVWKKILGNFLSTRASYTFSFSDDKEDILSRPASIKDAENNESEDELSSPSGHDLKGENVTYYQSLIDQRDCPYIVSFEIGFRLIYCPTKFINLFLILSNEQCTFCICWF